MIYAIGDIHGQHEMLDRLLKKLDALPIAADDTLLFLGDYIDRGPDSRRVIDMLLELQEKGRNVVFLRGNHEQLMLDARDEPLPTEGDDSELLCGSVPVGEATMFWLSNGGTDTLCSYKEDFRGADLRNWWEFIPAEHWAFLEATRLEYVTPRFCFVHAGVLPPDEAWEHAALGLDPRLWIREEFLSSRNDFGGKIVVFGHTPQRSGRPLVQRNKIGIDTGAVFGGRLTAGAFDPEGKQKPSEVRFVQV